MSKDKEATEANGDSATDSANIRGPSRKKPTTKANYQIDIREALEAPVRVKRDGDVKPIDPYEAMLLQLIRKSVVEKDVASIKSVLREAEKHKIIKEPPAAATGGIFIVPKELPEEIQRKIFSDPDYASGEPASMSSLWWHVLSVVSFKRFLESFNGRRKAK